MERRALGKTGIECGVIGMGTWRTFDVSPGEGPELDLRREIVTAALEAGTNLFDSSPMYGSAEQVLARALDGRRLEALVATKVWSPSVPRGRHQIEEALKLYGGRVDVYQVHNLVAWESYLPMLRELRNRGSVRAIGVTHYAHSAFSALRGVMERETIDMVQIPYNATDRVAERELLPLAAELGLGVLVMSPLGTGQLTAATPPAAELRFVEDVGLRTWAQALLKWVISDPRVTATIPATSRVERARENALAGRGRAFNPEERERIAWLADRYVG